MKSEHDPSLVFDEQAIGPDDVQEVRVVRTPEGFTLQRGAGSPIDHVMETLEIALAQGSTIYLVIA